MNDKVALVIIILIVTIFEANCANITYDEAKNLTAAINDINKPSEDSSQLVAGIEVLPGLLDGLVMINVIPESYTVKDIWTSYVVGLIAFDKARHDYPEIYRGYISVKIQGEPYTLEVASPDLVGISYNNWSDASIISYYNIANELVNKQLAYNYPMKEASDYIESNV